MKKLKFKNSKPIIIHDGQYIRFIKHEGWEFVERSNCTGIVIIVPLTKDNEVIFVEQFRPPVKKKVIEFPAGLVNDHNPHKQESMLTAARRELWEETGYHAKTLKKLLEGPVSGGLTSDQVTMVLATDLSKTGSGGGDETEKITIHKIPLEKVESWLRRMQRKGFLIEPKIYAGLYFLSKYNKKS